MLPTDFNFIRITEAIHFIKTNADKQPSLEDIACHVNVSSHYLQKIFTAWAGVSPKKFQQYITLAYAKSLLKRKHATLFDTTITTGLSSTSRLHDLFTHIEAMTPAEFKNGGYNLSINYSFANTAFGNIIIASTNIGICHIAFFDGNEAAAVAMLKNIFANANLIKKATAMHHQVCNFFSSNLSESTKIKLHLKGTDFQLKVWEALLTIPMGALATYGDIASKIKNPKAARAVGSAIADNPIAFLIPCHRVIQSTGIFGQYMWGEKRKTAIIGWEAAHTKNK